MQLCVDKKEKLYYFGISDFEIYLYNNDRQTLSWFKILNSKSLKKTFSFQKRLYFSFFLLYALKIMLSAIVSAIFSTSITLSE